MKKTIITSAILLFAQIAIFSQTPVVTAPSNASVQTPKNDKKGREKDQNVGNRDKQPKMTAADRAVQYSNQLKTGLGLSNDQYQKVLAVNTECITRKDAMRGGGDKGAMKTGKADIKAYRLGEFQKIFTADQMTKYQSMNNNNNNDDKDSGKGKNGEEKKSSN